MNGCQDDAGLPDAVGIGTVRIVIPRLKVPLIVKSQPHAPQPGRRLRDEELKEQIMKVWDQPGPGNRLYGARKIWLELNAAGIKVARCTVERLMRELGIAGVGTPAKKPRTTVGSDAADRPSDLLERDFGAAAPNARWVADITYVPTASGWCYTAFVMDLYSRGIAGWAVADHLRAELALDALEMGIWRRKDRIGSHLIHHSDRGVQGGFNRSSQHLDHGGSRWDAAGSSCRSRRRVHAGSGQRIGRCARRCVHLAGLSPHVRCNGSSGG